MIPVPGGGGGETPYDALEDIEPFFFNFLYICLFFSRSLKSETLVNC